MTKRLLILFLVLGGSHRITAADEPLLTGDERAVYREVLRGIGEGDLGIPPPPEQKLFLHYKTLLAPMDTFVTIKLPPPGYSEAIKDFRHGPDRGHKLTDLATENLNVVDIFSDGEFGCRVAFSQIGFGRARHKAVVMIRYDWHTSSYSYFLKAMIFLDEKDSQWNIISYRPLDVSRGFEN